MHQEIIAELKQRVDNIHPAYNYFGNIDSIKYLIEQLEKAIAVETGKKIFYQP